MTEPPTTNVTFAIPEDVMQALKKIAEEQGISLGSALTTSVTTTAFFLDQINAGKKVLLEDRNKRLSEVQLLPSTESSRTKA